ncbi:fibrous sheath-interacting protein 2 [Ochotona princeps]|uniref:fibrous sheath-interacting protein 2 n=1 Tax=Ochotona princeps TaxID=9978 RepID=UPI002714A51B|nr:fibrous sheath-interacting protein 2 [Ochotona princeps]
MELYLSACSKAANVTAAKTAASSLAADSQQCGDGTHKTHFPGVGAAQLLDLPLGVKLPVIPGSDTVFFTTNISEKLFRPSYGFNLTDPYCRLLENQYKSLHDPHLRAYYKRKDILRRLKKGGYITSNNKIVCTLRELNKYRQYLTSLKLDFERNYIREQKMLAKQLHRLQETPIPGCSGVTHFQNWFLQGGTQSVKDRERLIRHRYLDMISRELEQRERTAEEQRLLRMDREERQQREHTRRKLNLRRKIEEEWKTKEMLLLTRIEEDVKREQRIEEQRRKNREESDRKKQALLERKMAYHLQKMQDTGFKEDDVGKSVYDYRGQDGPLGESSPKKKKKSSDDKKLLYPVDDQKMYKEAQGQASNTAYSQSNTKDILKKSASLVVPPDVQDDTEKKLTKKSSVFDIRGAIYTSAQESTMSAQPSPTKIFPRSSQSFLDPQKSEKDTNVDWNQRTAKRSSHFCEPGPQTRDTAASIFPNPVYSNTQQNLLQNCLHEKVTSEELYSIIQNIMTWVVATVTSILYPAITKYEERLQNITYPVSDDSVLSSDSSSFCSTCSEEFAYGNYTSTTTKTFQTEPCTFEVDMSARRPTTAFKPPSAHVERRVVGTTYHRAGPSLTSELNCNKPNLIYLCPKLRSCKSDSHLLLSFETSTKTSKDATTETDSLVSPLFSDYKTKAVNEVKNLKNVFVDFKCHLKGETELILGSIFQEIMSDLTQAIPSLSSVTAEVFVDQNESDKEDLLSNVDICSVASDIVESMLEKLEFAVEKKYVEIFSQEDLSINISPVLTDNGEYFMSSNGKPSEASLPCTLEPMNDIAEDMVQAILEKLMCLTYSKQNEITHFQDTNELSNQQSKRDSPYMMCQPDSSNKCSARLDTANLILKEEVQGLMSHVFSQSSLVGHIKEAVSVILGYVQAELNNERLIASEDTVALLQILDDIFSKLHEEPVQADDQKSKQPKERNADIEEKYRLAGTRLSNSPRSRSFPPVNVPGMVVYSEDDNEEINKIVNTVLDSSVRDEKEKSQENTSDHWFTKGNTYFENKNGTRLSSKPPSQSKAALHDWGLKTELPPLINESILKKKCLHKDTSIFSQEQKQQIQMASETIVKDILAEMFKDTSCIPPGHVGCKSSKDTSVLVSEKPQESSHQEHMDQMFSVSEISSLSQEITDTVINILHKASHHINNTAKYSVSSSALQTHVDNFDTSHTVKDMPNKKPLKIWFDSDKKMKYLSSINVDPVRPSWLNSEESDPKPVDDIIHKIINTVFKRLKAFICPKLRIRSKPLLVKHSSLQSHLSTYTAKVVHIVLRAIQNELEHNKKVLCITKTDHARILPSKGFFVNAEKKFGSLVINPSDDVMGSPLLTLICEILLSGNERQGNVLLPSGKARSEASDECDNADKQHIFSTSQNSFRKSLAKPCTLHSVSDTKDLKKKVKLQVLDRIGETVHEMIGKLTRAHPHCQPCGSQQTTEKTNSDQEMTTSMQSNVKLISKTILEYVLAKLCDFDLDTSLGNSEFKPVSESLNIDSLSFESIIEQVTKCTSIISRMIQGDNNEVTKIKEQTASPMFSKVGSTEETQTNKLKVIASDILNTVFAKLEGFANGNLETLGVIKDKNKNSSNMDWKCESHSVFTDTHEEPLHSILYMQAKKVSSTILKAIQTELNMNPSGLKTSVKTSPPETQMLKNIVNLISDAVSSDIFSETEPAEEDIKTYQYKPSYGNLPGGAESDSLPDDDTQTMNEFIRESTLVREETNFHALKRWILQRTLNKMEVKLKEACKSPVAPIIKNILNEIFQTAFTNQLNVQGMPHNVFEPTAHTSVQFVDSTIHPLVSDTDVTIVANDVVKTVFHKLHSAVMTETNVRENRYKTITFSANVSFQKHAYGGNSSVTLLDRNPCTLQTRFSVDKQIKMSITEDIIQEILTILETFATSKIESLFSPQLSTIAPVALSSQQSKSTFSKSLSSEDSHYDEQLSCGSVDHIKSGKTNSLCQLPMSKLNTYATEVARKILQGIKHELDRERESPSLTHNVVAPESIASQVVNSMLTIVSCKSKYNKNNSNKQNDSDQQGSIFKTLFNKPEYQKTLQTQIQDAVQDIINDIYEKTLYYNISFPASTMKYGMTDEHLETNSEMFIEDAKIIPKFSLPKSDVILLANDIVNIILHNLSSAVMLRMNAILATSARSHVTTYDTFPKNELEREHIPHSQNQKSAYADDNQTTEVENEETKKFLNPYEENANTITKTISSRLEAFMAETMDSIMTLAFQNKIRSIVIPELEIHKQDGCSLDESRQVESDVNVLKVSTEPDLSQQLTHSAFASYREKNGYTINLSQTSLIEGAEFIASTTLKLIKNDIDLEFQKMHQYSNNISFQETIIVSEIVNSILKILYGNRSASNILLGDKEKEKNTKLSLLTEYPLEQKQITLVKESQRILLEDLFMKKRELKQKEKTELLSAVEEILKKLDQRVIQVIGDLLPFNEIPCFNSKIETDITHKNRFHSEAKDILESVLEKIYSLVVTLLSENTKRGQTETSESSDTSKLSSFRETKQSGKASNSPRYVVTPVYPSAENQRLSVFGNTFWQYSPLQVGKDLVQMVLNKITKFLFLHLEESLSSEDGLDELQLPRLRNSKISSKGSPKPSLKMGLKPRTKITSLPKCRTKQNLGPSGSKVKSKNRLSPGEKIPKGNWSSVAVDQPYSVSIADAKNLLKAKLPTSELKIYAKDIIISILEKIVKEFEKVKQTKGMENIAALQSDHILEASKIVSTVLQELYASDNHNLSRSTKLSYLDRLKPSQGIPSAGSLAEQQSCFYLENVSSQLEQIFPKDGIFKQMFDKWQTESNDKESDKYKLLMIAENILTEISIKAKDLEYSLSLLNLPHFEDRESMFYTHYNGVSSRAEDAKAQINMFGREIVEMLFEKLQLCFLSQMPSMDSKETLPNRKEHITATSQHSFPAKHMLSNLPEYNMKTKDQMSMDSSNQIVQEIVQRVLDILESFVDLQFKHISKYEFSEIVKMPIETLFPVHQRLLSKKMLPKLQPLKRSSAESMSNTPISKENIQNTLLEVHSFHSELLTYAVAIVSDMLDTVKNKLDKEISQMEPSSSSVLKENTVASEIIGTLMDQCAHFHESLIKNFPKESLFQGSEKTYVVNHTELATNMKMSKSKTKETSLGNNPPQRRIPGHLLPSEENVKHKYKVPSDLISHANSSVESKYQSSKPAERPHSKIMSSCFRNKIQSPRPKKIKFSHFDEVVKKNSSFSEDSVLKRLSRKANDSTEAAFKQVMSFIEGGKGENPRVFYYETPKPLVESNQIQTTVSPLKICLAAENIVNTVLSNYDFPSQLHPNGSMETIKPFFISKQSPLTEISGGQKNEETSLLRIWSKRINFMLKKENKNPESSTDFPLLQKWQNSQYTTKIETLKEIEAISFADHELGPNEIHLVARHVTTSVITHFKNFKTRVSTEEMVSIVSTLSMKKYEQKQPLRSIYHHSSIYQFCEHLTKSVIYHLASSISGDTKKYKEKEKIWEMQDAAFNKMISIHSHIFGSRSISIGELALSISEIVIEILFNGNIIEADIAQQVISIKTKYIYCSGVASADFDNLFQDLLIGVIHVLSKEIGINHHFESSGTNQSLSSLRSNSMSICSKTNTVERLIDSIDSESSTHQVDQLIQKNKLNYLAQKLDHLAGSLTTQESKEVVSKVFDIVLDLFMPDECPDGAVDPGELAQAFCSSPHNQSNQSDIQSRGNLGLSPKLVFLLNVVCEKLIRTLLEKCTSTVFLDSGSSSDETSTKENQLSRILQSLEDGEFDFFKEKNCEQFQQDSMLDLSENLTEMDQNTLSSDTMLTAISHRLVKSLMEKLSQSLQQASESPPFKNKLLNCRTRETQYSFTKLPKTELTDLGQGQSNSSLGFMSDDGNYLTKSLENPISICSKAKDPLSKQYTVKSSFLKRQEAKEMKAIGFTNRLHRRDTNIGVFSATFLEEIISELFFNLSTTLWSKYKSITEAQLNETNALFINIIVSELNNAQVTVLRNAEEKLCFPPVQKETVKKIVDSIYHDVLHQYELKVTCGNNTMYDNTSVVEQITNDILLEILDYQLPSNFSAKLPFHSYYSLRADIILQKLQNNLRKFICQPKSSTTYSTMLSQSFLEDAIKRLLFQLFPAPSKAFSMGKNYLMSSDFNEMSRCIINKVISAISKHKIGFTICDNQYLCQGKNLETMVNSIYSNILQISESLDSIQRGIISRTPAVVDRITSFIIQEIIDNHLQQFLGGEILPRPGSPLDSVSDMVKEILSEAIESHRPQQHPHFNTHPDTIVRNIVTRLLSKIFSPKHSTEVELDEMTQKIVNLISNHLDKNKSHALRNYREQCFPSIDTDTVDELVTSVYGNVLKQLGLDTDTEKELKDGEVFVENIANLIVANISDSLLQPFFSGDLSASSYPIRMADTIVHDVISNISKPTKLNQTLSSYNTLLPYTFLEDMIRVLLCRLFPCASNMVLNRESPKDASEVNFNEIASNLISDIRMKICQHEIRFSKDEEETKFAYSEDDVQHLVNSVLNNISQNSGSQELAEQNITSSNDALIDRIAGFIIKYVCQKHLHPFLDGKSLSSSSYTNFDDEQMQLFYVSAYSSEFLEDIVCGVLSKIFHRVIGIVQTKLERHSEDELFDKAEELIHLIIDEFSKSKISIIDSAEGRLYLPQVEKDVVKKIIDTVYSKVLQEYEMRTMPGEDFLYDTITLAAKITKVILAEIFDFQIHPDIIENLPSKSYSKLNANVLIKRVQHDISKSLLRGKSSTIYTTMLPHTHLEKIVTQLISQMSPFDSSLEDLDACQSDLNNTVIKLINEIMSIISKHAICIIKHGNEKQNMFSEKDMQSMIDSISADLSYSNLYQSLTKDKKGKSNIPVSKIASLIIKEIFNHHLQSFLTGDKTLLSAPVDRTYKQKELDPKHRKLSLIVNSAVFFEEVISELLCKILYAFTNNVSAAENLDRAKARITDIVTALVKSIVLEFTTSEILVADSIDENLHFSEGYKEMVQNTVNIIYEKILDEYKSLIQVYRVIQSDTDSFGKKIYNLLLEEIYDYQVQSLVSGELLSASYSSLRADNIIRNVLNIIMKDSYALPSCITVLPHSLLEDMVYKLLVHIFPSSNTEHELKEEEVLSDYESVDAASKLTDEIIKEISEHEIRLATAEENAESIQLEAIENFADSICNNILKNSEFQAEVHRDTDKKQGSFLSKIASFILKAIMDHHLKPFLHDEESSSSDLPDHVTVLAKSGKEKAQPALYSATFLEDVIVNLVHKFCAVPAVIEDPKKKERSEPDIVGLAIKFANSLIGEFTKNEIKILPHAEDIFPFPPIDKEAVDKISNFVYDQFIGKYSSDVIPKNDNNNFVVEVIATLAQKAISAFKIQPLFSGDWSSTFFSFLNPENITQRVQKIPPKTTQITRCLSWNQLILPEKSSKHSSVSSDHKTTMDTLEVNRMNKTKSVKTKNTSMKKIDIKKPVPNTVTAILKANTINLRSKSAECVANKKGEGENRLRISMQKRSDHTSKIIPTINMKHKDIEESELNEIRKRSGIETSISSPKAEKALEDESHRHILASSVDTECKKEVLEPDTEIEIEKKIESTGESSFKKDDKPFHLFCLKSKQRDIGTITDKTLEKTQRSHNEKRRDSSAQIDMDEEQHSDEEYVENITENIYDNVFEIPSQESAHFSKYRHSKTSQGDKILNVIKDISKDSTPSLTTKDLLASVNKNVPSRRKEKEQKEREKERRTERKKEKEMEKEKDTEKEKKRETKKQIPREREINSESSEPDHPPDLANSKPKVFPATFLEDVVIEMVNKLVFSSSPETQTCDKYSNLHDDDDNQTELYDTAMKLIDSLLKEFSDSHIKVFRPDMKNQFLPPAHEISSGPKVPSSYKESSRDEALPSIKTKPVEKVPHMHKQLSSAKAPLLNEMLSIDKTMVNKVVHSSICNILKEYRSQDSICKNINSNGENLAKKLTSAVINEIFQHQLNVISCDVPVSECRPLESRDVYKKVQKVTQTASKECQTSSPYTIMLPYKFLDDVISALLSKIFSTISNSSPKIKAAEGNSFMELDFLQMKLVSIVAMGISKNEDMTIQYVESLHSNDDEIIQLVVQSIYDNLLPLFGSQEIIQNCVASGCRILSETIADLVIKEITGNQLQRYFCGELSPYQYTDVDSIVENILKDIIQPTDIPPLQPPNAHKMSYTIMEEVTVKFLSKILAVLPNVQKEKTKPLETEMQRIISKILNSVQEFISKSKIKLVLPANESPTVSLAENAGIEKIVNSVCTNILKHSGSYTSILKDLLGNSKVLSDIIGFLMVKEISNSEFQPQGEEEVSNTELALEAVKIMEKVIKITDEFKFQDKASSQTFSVLDGKFLEEILALLSAKLVRPPNASSKDTSNVSQPELNKIASQLTKSVTAEISKSNISLVAANTENTLSNAENTEMVSQVVNSVYSNVLQYSGTNKEINDIKDTKILLPDKVASLIIEEVLNSPLSTGNTKSAESDLFGDLDLKRIVEKAQEHVIKVTPDSDREESDHDSYEEEFPIKIIPHVGRKPIKVDPNIISEHLAVISVKTQPLEKIKMECLRRTGHSIAELRKASLSGRSYCSLDSCALGNRKKERRISLNMIGRLDVKPLEPVCRNSFQSIRKPDITKVELLKDVHCRRDLITRLVAHDIEHGDSETNLEETISDEVEIVLGEVVGQQECTHELCELQLKDAMKPTTSKAVTPKNAVSAGSLKRFLALSKCCHPTYSANIENTEAISNLRIESNERQVKKATGNLDMATTKILTETNAPREKKLQSKKEERLIVPEPPHFLLHRIMSSSSYNQDDLISTISETEQYSSDPSASVLEESYQERTPEHASSVKFITIFEGSNDAAGSAYSSKETIADSPKASISKQGSNMLAKVSSALSKVFSRPNNDTSKSSSPSNQNKQ